MLTALLGGVLIGCSAVLLMLANGRIAGISGIAYGVFLGDRDERYWRGLFLLGLLLGAFTVATLASQALVTPRAISTATLLLGGFLVGLGTRLANGCTSGHGVCGLARFSGRSATAVAVFLSTAMLTVYVVRHVLA